MSIKFTVLGPPQGKQRPRVTRNGTYTPQKTVDYENLIKIMYINTTRHIFNNKEPLAVVIDAYFEPVKSTSKKKRKQMLDGLIYPTKKPDSDNIGKVVCDALNEVAYGDDTQVVRLEVNKLYSEIARVEVEIKEVT